MTMFARHHDVSSLGPRASVDATLEASAESMVGTCIPSNNNFVSMSTTSSTSGGYSPDVDEKSDESSFTIDDDSESCGGIETELNFLQEKANILKRVVMEMKHEQSYDASKALQIVKQSEQEPAASIWTEARQVLDIMDNEPDDVCVGAAARKAIMGVFNGDSKHFSILNRSPVNTTATSEQIAASSTAEAETERAAKRPRIDTRSVLRLTSKDVFSECLLPPSFPTSKPKELPFLPSGLWKATLSSSFPRLACTKTNWKVIADPNYGASVVPPSDSKQTSILENAIPMQDALNFTPIPQVVALASPPYSIVHANQAFCARSANNCTVGKPMDSILQVVSTSKEPDERKRCKSVRGRLLIPGGGRDNDCQLAVTPIKNRIGISHLLVEVLPTSAVLSVEEVSYESESLPALEPTYEDDSGDSSSLDSSDDELEVADIWCNKIVG